MAQVRNVQGFGDNLGLRALACNSGLGFRAVFLVSGFLMLVFRILGAWGLRPTPQGPPNTSTLNPKP